MPDLDDLQPFACAPVAVLGGLVRGTRGAGGGPLLGLPDRVQNAGRPLDVTLRGAEGATVLLDLYRPDGSVDHLPVNGGGPLHVVLPQNAPAGPRLLSVLISPAPLQGLELRPPTERTDAYLARLQQALPSSPELRADLATLEVRPVIVATKPVPALQAARSPRCAGILEKAQLGEALSDGERAILRADCH